MCQASRMSLSSSLTTRCDDEKFHTVCTRPTREDSSSRLNTAHLNHSAAHNHAPSWMWILLPLLYKPRWAPHSAHSQQPLRGNGYKPLTNVLTESRKTDPSLPVCISVLQKTCSVSFCHGCVLAVWASPWFLNSCLLYRKLLINVYLC